MQYTAIMNLIQLWQSIFFAIIFSSRFFFMALFYTDKYTWRAYFSNMLFIYGIKISADAKRELFSIVYIYILLNLQLYF